MTLFPEYDSFDGTGLAGLVESGVISPIELLEAAIERIELRNPALNAVVHKMYDEARRNISHLEKGPFYGVPFLLKDMLADYVETPITYGSRFMEGYVSPYDSELVKRFKQAGLNILGKTNLPEFGLSPVTEPALFGPTHNPWDLTKTCGGSSGGSAVAVAARMVPMAHGGDGGGSIRIPAAYCGIFGFKPTRGRTPTGPYLMQIAQGLVVEHVLTRSVRDSAAMLDAITGPEPGSIIAWPKPANSFLSQLTEPSKPLRIAFSDQPFFPYGEVHAEYQQAFQHAIKLCETLGHQLVPLQLALPSHDVPLAYLIYVAADLAACIDKLTSLLTNPKRDKLETATAILYEIGGYFSAKDVVWANQTFDTTRRYFAGLADEYDIFMTPTMPFPPLAMGEFKVNHFQKNILEVLRHVPYGPILKRMVQQLSTKYFVTIPFTPIFNITGQPAMSVPLFWDKQGLPIGIQFAGHYGDDKTLFQLAYQLENAQPWADRKPPLIACHAS